MFTTPSRVSVIVPAHQEETQIRETLDSLVRQTVPPHEVIVVANGCTDHTADIARTYSSKIPSLRVIETEERGIGFACNRGVRASTGDIVAIVEADTTLSSNAIQAIATEITAGDYIGGTIHLRTKERGLRYRFFELLCALQEGADWGPVRFCTRETYDRIGGHREDADQGVDGDFSRKVKERGPVVYIETAYHVTSMRRYERLGTTAMIKDAGRYLWQRITHKRIPGAYPVVR
jgi:glycosyltransferase involved in cell wall biosynthesis